MAPRISEMAGAIFLKFGMWTPGADLGFIKGGGLTQGTNLLGRGHTSQHASGGSGGMPPQENFEK